MDQKSKFKKPKLKNYLEWRFLEDDQKGNKDDFFLES